MHYDVHWRALWREKHREGRREKHREKRKASCPASFLLTEKTSPSLAENIAAEKKQVFSAFFLSGFSVFSLTRGWRFGGFWLVLRG